MRKVLDFHKKELVSLVRRQEKEKEVSPSPNESSCCPSSKLNYCAVSTLTESGCRQNLSLSFLSLCASDSHNHQETIDSSSLFFERDISLLALSFSRLSKTAILPSETPSIAASASLYRYICSPLSSVSRLSPALSCLSASPVLDESGQVSLLLFPLLSGQSSLSPFCLPSSLGQFRCLLVLPPLNHVIGRGKGPTPR